MSRRRAREAGSVHDGPPAHCAKHERLAQRERGTLGVCLAECGWMKLQEAAQSSSPPSSSTEKTSLHSDSFGSLVLCLFVYPGRIARHCQDKKSTLGMHLTQLQSEDPKSVTQGPDSGRTFGPRTPSAGKVTFRAHSRFQGASSLRAGLSLPNFHSSAEMALARRRINGMGFQSKDPKTLHRDGISKEDVTFSCSTNVGACEN